MNILPKKRWHVRTKENIARVRRDEAQAAEEEKEKERRIKLAEKEARRDLMRARARAKLGGNELGLEDSDIPEEKASNSAAESSSGHINFFADEEAGLASSTAVNKEHEEEAKQDREKYEKQIGYLTYLGQDTNEATGKVSWYNKCPQRDEIETSEETGLKHKITSDPLNAFKKYCSSVVKKSTSLASDAKNTIPPTKRERSRTPEERKKDVSHKHKKKKSKKHKKEKKHRSKSSSRNMDKKSSSSSESESDHSDNDTEKKAKLEKLRAERLRREKEEKKKAEKLLAKVNGVAYVDEDVKPQPKPVMKQRYNSQFNPDIAKQNYDDQRYRF